MCWCQGASQYLRPGCGSACSSCCCTAGNLVEVWRSERSLCDSGSESDRCSETWSPETTTSWGFPPGTSAWGTGRRDTCQGTCPTTSPDTSHRPEEGMMLHTDFPQSFSCSVVQQLEANGGLKLVKLDTQMRHEVRGQALRTFCAAAPRVSPLQVGS